MRQIPHPFSGRIDDSIITQPGSGGEKDLMIAKKYRQEQI